jgi:hypothetical protein
MRFGARDCDPAIERWTAKDPSGFAGGTNLYAYADNDPVNLLDLTGEHPVVFLMLAGAMEGIAGDLFFQMVVQGKRRGCLDGTEVAMAGIMARSPAGWGDPLRREHLTPNRAPRSPSEARVSAPHPNPGTSAPTICAGSVTPCSRIHRVASPAITAPSSPPRTSP